MPPDRIQTYQRQLAEDEARLRRELAKAPDPARAGGPAVASRMGEPSPSDPIADEQRRREYQSLFADNVALSRRPGGATSYADRATGTRPVASPMASATMSPQELVLLQALVSQPRRSRHAWLRREASRRSVKTIPMASCTPPPLLKP